mmetsp:Transcript_22368/g.34072  ORF Transcript_22368/g.34072 Transcript_22368/m.34072 type:complete len:259 (+) Transcript_22368:595-1371(+)
MFTHGQLLQVIIRLEEYFADARACQPCGLEPFHLHRGLRVLNVHWIQREHRLPVVTAAHLQCGGQVLQIDGRSWIDRGGDAHRVSILIENHATHALRYGEGQFHRGLEVAGNVFDLPADFVLRAACLLRSQLLLLVFPLLRLQIMIHELSHALTVYEILCVVPGGVRQFAHWKAAMAAQHQLWLHGLVVSSIRLWRLGAQITFELGIQLVIWQFFAFLHVPSLQRAGSILQTQKLSFLCLCLTETHAIELDRQLLIIG